MLQALKLNKFFQICNNILLEGPILFEEVMVVMLNLWKLAQCWSTSFCLKVLKPRPLVLLLRRMLGRDEYGTLVEWYWQGKTQLLGQKVVSVSLCPPPISHGLVWCRTLAPATFCTELYVTQVSTCCRHSPTPAGDPRVRVGRGLFWAFTSVQHPKIRTSCPRFAQME
jgi:hypothetical protein